MLVQFSVENYKTFSEKATLNMIASNYYKEEDDNIILSTNENLKYSLVKSVILYGANASGKSKLFDAINFMKKFIINSFTTKAHELIDIDIFKLNTNNFTKPSFFEMIFIFNNEQYRYGFEATTKEIISEWLY